jgi:hypothetical protein
LIFSYKLTTFWIISFIFSLWPGALFSLDLLIRKIFLIFFLFDSLLSNNIAGFSFFLFRLFVNIEILRFIKGFKLILFRSVISFVINGISLLIFIRIVIFFVLLCFRIPLLYNVSSIKSFTLSVDWIFILSFRLEIRIVDIKIWALEIVCYLLVR